MTPTAKELLSAVEEVIGTERRALTFSRIAEGAQLEPADVPRLLLQAARETGAAIDFRYPPLPEGAVIAVHRRA